MAHAHYKPLPGSINVSFCDGRVAQVRWRTCGNWSGIGAGKRRPSGPVCDVVCGAARAGLIYMFGAGLTAL